MPWSVGVKQTQERLCTAVPYTSTLSSSEQPLHAWICSDMTAIGSQSKCILSCFDARISMPVPRATHYADTVLGESVELGQIVPDVSKYRATFKGQQHSWSTLYTVHFALWATSTQFPRQVWSLATTLCWTAGTDHNQRCHLTCAKPLANLPSLAKPPLDLAASAGGGPASPSCGGATGILDWNCGILGCDLSTACCGSVLASTSWGRAALAEVGLDVGREAGRDCCVELALNSWELPDRWKGPPKAMSVCLVYLGAGGLLTERHSGCPSACTCYHISQTWHRSLPLHTARWIASGETQTA